MKRPKILYSTNTKLAYFINQKYYKGRHFVWCAPSTSDHAGKLVLGNPPTSNPLKIYDDLRATTQANDRHCAKIKQNKLGILKGAEVQRSNGNIPPETYTKIALIVDQAAASEFSPILFVIPATRLGTRLQEVDVGDKANVMSEEYRIVDLRSSEFDPLVLP